MTVPLFPIAGHDVTAESSALLCANSGLARRRGRQVQLAEGFCPGEVANSVTLCRRHVLQRAEVDGR